MVTGPYFDENCCLILVLIRKWNDLRSCFCAGDEKKKEKKLLFCQKMALSVGNLTEETSRERRK
jgi:hypothetical protein